MSCIGQMAISVISATADQNDRTCRRDTTGAPTGTTLGPITLAMYTPLRPMANDSTHTSRCRVNAGITPANTAAAVVWMLMGSPPGDHHVARTQPWEPGQKMRNVHMTTK